MTNAEKTVFISYRRSTSKYLARAIFMDLREHGYDVFLDMNTIDSGAFDTIILNQIKARAHFLVLLSPGSLERCADEGDWLRREIVEALRLKRNVVPLIDEGFDLENETGHLPQTLRDDFRRFNGMRLFPDYFEEGMEKLRNRFLKQPLYGEVLPVPVAERTEVDRRVEEAVSVGTPTKEELSAEEYFNRAYARDKNDFEGKIADYTEVIRLNPAFTNAYKNRGLAIKKKGDLDGAIADYSEAIRLNPQDTDAYYSRGISRYDKGDLDGAIADYSEAIRLNPTFASAYNNRGELYFANKQYQEALSDFEAANSLLPYYQMTRGGLAISHHALRQIEQAQTIWRSLISDDARFQDAEWVRQELYWAEPLVEEARKLIATL
jgi:tetratricopeptide (TPR) repeat protein